MISYESLEKFKYDPTVYNQQSTSTSLTARATSSDIYGTHHTFIQNEGSNSNEEATNTSDEEEEEDLSYDQLSKETERDDTTKKIPQLTVDRGRPHATDVEEEGTLHQNAPTQQRLMGSKSLTPGPSKRKQSNHTPIQMV